MVYIPYQNKTGLGGIVRVHNTVKIDDDHKVTIYGANRWQRIWHVYDKETNEVGSFVKHYGRQYSLDEFVLTKRNPWGDAPEWMQMYDGYLSDSWFSGILIKLSDCGESAKVFTYIS